jgi:hypothetical protein
MTRSAYRVESHALLVENAIMPLAKSAKSRAEAMSSIASHRTARTTSRFAVSGGCAVMDESCSKAR